MKVLNYNGPVIQFIEKTVNLFLIYAISFICCIPIVTIGASLTARYYTTQRVLNYGEHSIFKPFFICFKENFKQSTKVWAVQAFIMAVLTADWIYIYNVGCTRLYWFMLLFVTFFILALNINIFSLISHYEMTIPALYRTALLITIVKIYYSILIFASFIGIIYLAYLYMGLLPLIIFAGCASILYLQGSFMKRIFDVWDKNEGLENDYEENVTEEGLSE
ncbi:MAG: DUF624 domain-containing protein [Eubacterium sp.]|nr:DUF624 domain-containing protein [Eubacterium sp.]